VGSETPESNQENDPKEGATSLGHTVILDTPTVLGVYDYTTKDVITVLDLNSKMIAGIMGTTATGATVTMQGQPTLTGPQPGATALDANGHATASNEELVDVTEEEAELQQAVIKETVRAREQQIEVWAKFLVIPEEELDEELMAKRRKAEADKKAKELAAGEDGSRSSLVAKAKAKLTPGLEKMGLEWAGVAEMLEGDSVSIEQLKQAIDNPDSFFQNFAQAAGNLDDEDEDEEAAEARAQAEAFREERKAEDTKKRDGEAKLAAQIDALANAHVPKTIVLVIPEYCCVDRKLLTAQPVLLSGQGMCGKTMMAKQLVLSLAQEPSQLGGADVLPILVDAADLAEQHRLMRAERIAAGVQADPDEELARLAPIEPAVVMGEYLKQTLPPMRYQLIASIFINTELKGNVKAKKAGGLTAAIHMARSKSKSVLLVVDGLDRFGGGKDEGVADAKPGEEAESNFKERVEEWLCTDLCHRVKLVVTMRGNAAKDAARAAIDAESFPEEDAWLYEGEGNEKKETKEEDEVGFQIQQYSYKTLHLVNQSHAASPCCSCRTRITIPTGSVGFVSSTMFRLPAPALNSRNSL
jgi:hypothetical protein